MPLPSFPCLHALAQRLHEVDDVAAIRALFRRLDGLAGCLALDQLSQRELVLVLELRGVEAARLFVEDMACELNHLLRDARTWYAFEDLAFIAHFLVIAQRGAEHPLASGLDGKNMLAVRERDARERDPALVHHGVPDDGKCLLAALAVRYDVVRPLVVALVDVSSSGTNLSMSIVCELSISPASSSSGLISTYLPLPSS